MSDPRSFSMRICDFLVEPLDMPLPYFCLNKKQKAHRRYKKNKQIKMKLPDGCIEKNIQLFKLSRRKISRRKKYITIANETAKTEIKSVPHYDSVYQKYSKCLNLSKTINNFSEIHYNKALNKN